MSADAAANPYSQMSRSVLIHLAKHMKESVIMKTSVESSSASRPSSTEYPLIAMNRAPSRPTLRL